MALITHRNTLAKLLPPWALRLNLFRVLYVWALMLDILLDMLLAAVKIRFPNLYSEESLSLLSRERGLVRGPNEPAQSFATRLQNWWDVWGEAGSFRALAQQLQAYALPATYKIYIVNNQKFRWTLAIDGTWTQDYLPIWTWDSHTDRRSRFWVILTNTALGVTGTGRIVDQPGMYVDQVGRDVDSDTPYLNFAVSDITDNDALRNIL